MTNSVLPLSNVALPSKMFVYPVRDILILEAVSNDEHFILFKFRIA